MDMSVVILGGNECMEQKYKKKSWSSRQAV